MEIFKKSRSQSIVNEWVPLIQKNSSVWKFGIGFLGVFLVQPKFLLDLLLYELLVWLNLYISKHLVKGYKIITYHHRKKSQGASNLEMANRFHCI